MHPANEILRFDQIGRDDVALVGGKGLSLGLMASAGLPVPAGFCLTAAAHRRLIGRSLFSDAQLVAALEQACQQLGDGPVAVRSSATAEDGAVTSFAGQAETFLGVQGTPAILQTIEACWASLDSERVAAYRRQQGLSGEDSMAVVVQRLIPAESAGVLFTRDPMDTTGRQLLIEASWGLGESVVSGKVTPDRYHLDRETGKLIDYHVAVKTIQRTIIGEEPVPTERQTQRCLSDEQLAELLDLARRVEAFYGDARDVEWAYAEGRFWLLQARPITASGAAEREQVRREEIAALRSRVAPGGTVWARFNLAEILPAPTPMTWAVVNGYLMSGKGGFGLMFRDLGFDPDPALDEEGIFDLVCGRPYCNLSREPKLHYREVPFEHSFAALKADPRRALYPTPTINPARFAWHFWLFLPIALPRLSLQMLLGALRRQRLARSYANRFREQIVPPFVRETQAAEQQDLSALPVNQVVDFFGHWVRRTLVEFARESLKPTALATLCMAELEQKLAGVLGPGRSREFVRELVMNVHPPAEVDYAAGLAELAAGRLDRATFLARFGHHGNDEMELSAPRWREDPSTLEDTGRFVSPSREKLSTEDRLRRESRLNAAQRALLHDDVQRVHDFLGLREAAKHYLLLGYALIRKSLLELDRRFELQGGIFYLTPSELPQLVQGADLSATIAQRRRRRTVALGLELPPVLFSDDLEAIGRPVAPEGTQVLSGIPLSSGVAEGPALVLEHPQMTQATDRFILVCPSTNPAWVPLFVRAAGLVMETGGVLSHGAIVAREFGLPAVAGLPGVLRRLHTGQRIRVDGNQGTVTLLED